MTIDKGFTIWARQSCESKIFLEKPDHWFKVWFYIVSKVNFKDNGKFKRGQGLFSYDELVSILVPKSSVDVIDRIMRYLRTDGMLVSTRTTRGLVITVNNYDKYQDIKNYTDGRQTVGRRRPDGTIHKALTNKELIKNTLESVVESDFKEIAETYKVSLSFVQKIYEELVLYCGSTGKKYANYKMTLMAWVRRKLEDKPTRLKDLEPNQILDIRTNPERLLFYKRRNYDVSRVRTR